MTITMTTQIDPPWTQLLPIRVGRVPRALSTPDRFVVIDDGPRQIRRRVDVYGDHGAESFAVEAAIIWHDWVVIGFGHQVYLVSLADDRIITVPLDAYFGSLYPTEAGLLIASAEHVWCLMGDGSVRWRSPRLGIDGVVIDRIDEGVIHGSGAWDPSGGWRPFALRCDTGASR